MEPPPPPPGLVEPGWNDAGGAEADFSLVMSWGLREVRESLKLPVWMTGLSQVGVGAAVAGWGLEEVGGGGCLRGCRRGLGGGWRGGW